MKKIILISALFIFTTLPSLGTATTWNYNASGTVLGAGNQELPVSGTLLISDQLWEWPVGSTPVTDPVTASQYGYGIDGYNLDIGNYSFDGPDGSLYIEWFGSFPGDVMWFLDNGMGEWSQWIGEELAFYNTDNTPYAASWYVDLAPVIELTGLAYYQDDQHLLSETPNLDLRLERTGPVYASVPEPSSLLVGSLCLVFLGRRRRPAAQ